MKKRPVILADILAKNSPDLTQIIKKTRVLNAVNHALQQTLDAPLKNHCIAANIAANQLVIHADTSAWATRIRYEQYNIIEGIKGCTNVHFLRSIVVKVRPISEEQPTPRRLIIPLSHTASENIRDTAYTINDPQLKLALQRLCKHSADNE